MTHILVGVDGSNAARAAVRSAGRLLDCVGAHRITLLTVIPSYQSAVWHADAISIPQGTWDELAAETRATADGALRNASAELGEFTGSVTRLIRRGDRVQQIAGAARELGADVILLGRGKVRWNLARALFRKSLADGVMQGAHCPVMEVHASYPGHA